MKSIYDEAIELRNRLSNDGTGTIYEEDYLLLDRILDELERAKKVEELLRLYRKAHIDVLNGELAYQIEALEEELK